VIGLVGGTVSAASRKLGHWISFGVTGGLMLGMVLYMLYNARKYRWGRPHIKYGPTIMTTFAALLIMADISRHVMQDIGWWPSPGSNQYRDDCEHENLECLSVVGWFFTIIMTYTGFSLLFVAALWNAKICEKLKDFKAKWNELRADEAEANADKQTGAV